MTITGRQRLTFIHITLVDQQQKLTPGLTSIDLIEDILGIGQNRILSAGQIGHTQYDRRLIHLLERPLDTDLFDYLISLADTGSIDETEHYAAKIQHLLYGITRCAGNIGNYGTILAEKRIHQRTLARIGRTNDSDRDTILDSIATTERISQTADMGQCLIDQSSQFGTTGKLHILLTEIQFEFQ